MEKFTLPFPDKELAAKELSYDSCYHKIPLLDRAACIELAWRRGEEAADMIYERYGGETDFFKIIGMSGLTWEKRDLDYVVGKQRYFSDYITGRKRITLYMKSIALWAAENGMDIAVACNMILSHEYFHYLEWNELGLTSRGYQVPMLLIGRYKLGRTGIRALSEIGAHAFAHRYYGRIEECRMC